MSLSCVLLWVQLVERAVHAHGDVQVVQPSVLTDLVHHGSHSGSTDLSRAAGHRAAHLLDDNTVITGAVEPQLLQDRPDLQQRQTITVQGGRRRGEKGESVSEVSQQQESHRTPHSCSQRLRWA